MNKYETIIPLINESMRFKLENGGVITTQAWDSVMQFVVDNWADTTDTTDPRFVSYMTQNIQLWDATPAELYALVTTVPPEFVEALFPVAVAQLLISGISSAKLHILYDSTSWRAFSDRWGHQILNTFSDRTRRQGSFFPV